MQIARFFIPWISLKPFRWILGLKRDYESLISVERRQERRRWRNLYPIILDLMQAMRSSIFTISGGITRTTLSVRHDSVHDATVSLGRKTGRVNDRAGTKG